MFRVCLRLVQFFVLSIPLNSFCSFQSNFSFTFPPRSVFKINSLTHSRRAVNTSRQLFPSVIAQLQPSVLQVMHRCTAASTNGNQAIPVISLQYKILQYKNTAAVSSSARQPRAHLPSSLVPKVLLWQIGNFSFPSGISS